MFEGERDLGGTKVQTLCIEQGNSEALCQSIRGQLCLESARFLKQKAFTLVAVKGERWCYVEDGVLNLRV